MKHVGQSYHAIFKNRSYMKTVLAAVINRFGDSIDSIAFTWLVYQVTQSAAWSAIVFGVNRLPNIFLQPLAGAVVEKWNKKTVLILTDVIRGFCVGFVATAYLIGFLNQWILLACTIIISSVESFRGPAATALIPKLLDQADYDCGLSLNSSACSAAELAGYGAAGAIIAASSAAAAIYVDMATFILSAAIILTLRVTGDTLSPGQASRTGCLAELRAGFNYLRDQKSLRFFLVLGLFMNGILVPFNSLQAPLVLDVLQADEYMLTVLSIALTVGMMAGAAAYPLVKTRIGGYTIVCLGCLSFGFYYLTFVLAGRLIHSASQMTMAIASASLTVGFIVALANSFFHVEFLRHVDKEYVARISAILGASCMAAIPAVSFLVGALAGWVSTATILLTTGIIAIIFSIVLSSKHRSAIPDNRMGAIVNGKTSRDIQAGQFID